MEIASELTQDRFIVPGETISAKSKIEHLGNLLLFLQVSWTTFQYISRQAFGYPLTVLGIHVLSQAICALLVYALWLNKPLNELDPLMSA